MIKVFLFPFFFHFKSFHTRKHIQVEPPDEVLLWRKLNKWVMSDEESYGKNGRMFTSLPWRIDETTDLLNRIHMGLAVARKYCNPSERTPNKNVGNI